VCASPSHGNKTQSAKLVTYHSTDSDNDAGPSKNNSAAALVDYHSSELDSEDDVGSL
jgi:hypothetical protein